MIQRPIKISNYAQFTKMVGDGPLEIMPSVRPSFPRILGAENKGLIYSIYYRTTTKDGQDIYFEEEMSPEVARMGLMDFARFTDDYEKRLVVTAKARADKLAQEYSGLEIRLVLEPILGPDGDKRLKQYLESGIEPI